MANKRIWTQAHMDRALKLQEENKLTQVEIASTLGVSLSTLQYHMRGGYEYEKRHDAMESKPTVVPAGDPLLTKLREGLR